ncbi:DUF998 domain-containing protein [Actinoplanes bogorensis]|uniref:DUF998 domain-containing protein n=1 Tax=Paractinoplanes bogorensis TaxID=1610840 RepID=A0ABS5YUG5_9ACTN|nr:DUF998 domain-containing protein [Actinoplanes bogorensis]MBU2667013.1 DUF998 domain-containing protein [Actinoplanes bogorensis]
METTAQRTYGGLPAVVGAAAFTLTWFVLGFVSDGYRMWDITVDSYSSIAQPISGLGLGSTAPVMNAAFVIGGILVSAGVWTAMSRWPGADRRPVMWARWLVSASGAGMAMCGIFTLESILLHTLGFLLAAVLPGIGFIVAARALRGTVHRRLAGWLWFAGPATLAGVAGYMATFNAVDAGNNVGVAGLIERVLLVVLMGSIAAIGLTGGGSDR